MLSQNLGNKSNLGECVGLLCVCAGVRALCGCAGVRSSACSHDPQPNWTWVQDIYSFGSEALSHLGPGTKLHMEPNVSVQLHQNVKDWNKMTIPVWTHDSDMCMHNTPGPKS